MANYDALRVASILGARGLGLGHAVGSLEPGKLADLAFYAADDNPLTGELQAIRRPTHVMVMGSLSPQQWGSPPLPHPHPPHHPPPDHRSLAKACVCPKTRQPRAHCAKALENMSRALRRRRSEEARRLSAGRCQVYI